MESCESLIVSHSRKILFSVKNEEKNIKYYDDSNYNIQLITILFCGFFIILICGIVIYINFIK